jgi:hypothetical protein
MHHLTTIKFMFSILFFKQMRLPMTLKICASIFLASLVFADLAEDFNLSIETNTLGMTQGCLAAPPTTEYGGYVKADFLYWIPHQEGLEYAYQQNSPSLTPVANLQNPLLLANTIGGRFKQIDFEWRPAFRVEAGYQLPLDDWRAFARWTRFEEEAKGDASISSISTQNLAAIWLGAEFNEFGYPRVLSAKAKWRLHYNVLDGGLSRPFHWGSRCLLAPEVGIRGFWVNQQFVANYWGADITQTPANFTGTNNFCGAGLFSQLNSQWFFHKNWSVLGNILGSLNFGRLKLGQHTASQIEVASSSPLRNVIHEVVYRTRFAYQASFGVEWSTYFSRYNDRKIAFSALYELSEWVHLNQLRRFLYSDEANITNFVPLEGTLGFQGISVTGRFDY